MASLFGSPSPDPPPTPPASSLRVQTSLDGKPRTIVWGRTRVPVNLIWYGDFFSLTDAAAAAIHGGKGGVFGGGNSGGNGSGENAYYAYVAMAVCEGLVTSIGTVWSGKSVTSLGALNLGFFPGSDSQTPWGYLASNHPDQALAFRHTCYLAAGPFSLGTSPSLPNITVEAISPIGNAATGIPDANFADVLPDALGNTLYGVPGWDSDWNGDWTNARNYWQAAGLFVSIGLTDQVTFNQWAADILTSLNCVVFFSDGKLQITPRGDLAISGNGATYTPPAAPLYDLDDNNFLENQGGEGTNQDPVAGVRKAPREQRNVVPVAYIDRSTDYNAATITAQNDVLVRRFGRRGDDQPQTWNHFQTAAAATVAGQLALGREASGNTYAVTLPPRFIRLDPGDLVATTDVKLGLASQWVRVVDIVENSDRSLSLNVEEYLQGTGAAPLYGTTAKTPYIANYEADPGDINPPMLFEPTDELAGGLQIWAAISGVSPTLYGGCLAYASYDDAAYQFIGKFSGAAKMGVLTATLASVAPNPTGGPTIDAVNTLSVDLSESASTLVSVSQADALALNTACWVQSGNSGEVIAYQTATLTAANKYDLSYLVRGGFGTEDEIGSHAIGAPICRLDSAIAKIPYDQGRIGSTIYLKFVPFNPWGGGGLSVADVPAHAYVITGAALASPLPVIENLTSKIVDGRLNLTWDEIDDFRNGIRYELRQGDTFAGALSLGTVAHPPFAVPGNGTYWVTGWCQPVASLIVRSETPVSLTVAGATITQNVIATFDCKANGWPGTFTGGAGIDSGLNAIRTGGAGNILTDTNVLADIDVLNLGGNQNGTYRPAFIVDAGRVTSLQVTISLKGTGVPVGQNILGEPDVLSMPDVLGSASAAFVDVFGSLLISQSSVGSILDDPSVLDDPDVLSYGIPFAAPQKYSPGDYVGQVVAFEFDLNTVDPATIALLLEAVISVSVPARVDNILTNGTLPNVGLSAVFTPNGSSTPAAFNGGPNGSSAPAITATWGDEQAGDRLYIDPAQLTKAGCFVQIINAGVGVTRNQVTIYAEGF